MQLQPVFGKSVLLGAGICSLFSGCVMPGPVGSGWEDPCSPEWPAACMPDSAGGPPAPLLSCLGRLPHHEGLPEAPPYPRFHPLPTRPMLSPRADTALPDGPLSLESLESLQAAGAGAPYGALP